MLESLRRSIYMLKTTYGGALGSNSSSYIGFAKSLSKLVTKSMCVDLRISCGPYLFLLLIYPSLLLVCPSLISSDKESSPKQFSFMTSCSFYQSGFVKSHFSTVCLSSFFFFSLILIDFYRTNFFLAF